MSSGHNSPELKVSSPSLLPPVHLLQCAHTPDRTIVRGWGWERRWRCTRVSGKSPVNRPPAAQPGPLCFSVSPLCASLFLNLWLCLSLPPSLSFHFWGASLFVCIYPYSPTLSLSVPVYISISLSKSLPLCLLLCFSPTYSLLPGMFLSVASVSVPYAYVCLCWPLFPSLSPPPPTPRPYTWPTVDSVSFKAKDSPLWTWTSLTW